jgi:methionyl-tRNA formyltransferase
MRIVILTHSEDRHYYFANTIIEETRAVVGVVTGAKTAPAPAPDWRKKSGRRELIYRLRNRLVNLGFRGWRLALEAEKREEEMRAFAGAMAAFEERHAQLRIAHVGHSHPSINDAALVALIREHRPDAIAIMGTALVKQGVIESAPFVINMHTGLSPYYRGGLTNFWPIVEDDPGYFGVTIHRISLGIDSGDIIYTARPRILVDDNYPRVNCRCIKIGTSLMIQALEHVRAGDVKSVPQWVRGKLFFDRDMNSFVAYRYWRKRAEFFSRHHHLEEAGQLPQPRLIMNGEG